MPRRLVVLVVIVAFAMSASSANAIVVPINAPPGFSPFGALHDLAARIIEDTEQIVASIERAAGNLMPGPSLSYAAAAAAPVSEPTVAPSPPANNPPLTPSTTIAAAAEQPSVAAAIIPSTQSSGDAVSARLTSLTGIVGNVLALLPSLENQQPQPEAASVQSQIDALSHEIAQTNQINNLSNVTLSSPTFTSSSGGTGLSTSQVSEGSNLYFTNARVASYINSSSTIPSAAGGSWGNVLAWNGSNWTSLATSSLGLGGGAGATWGSISGTLADQTDLQSALTAKLSTTSLPAITALGNLASVGTITSGTWQGSPIAAAYGGTGWANINAGSILFGNGASALATSSNLYWDNADGRLGIGTTSPTALLTLDSSSPNGTIMRVSNSSTGGHIYDWHSTGSANTGGAGRLDLYDYTVGAPRLSIASNGNVGIGTTSPYSMLSVAGQVAAQNFVATSTTNSVLPYLDVTNNTNLFNSMNDYRFGYSATTTPNIIWDSDMGDDADSAGAAAVLLHAADLGLVNILAETYSQGRNCGVSVFSADDTYYGRPNIPIGQDSDPASVSSDHYCTLTQEYFPNSENGSTTPSALIVDRKALADASDDSVTMVFTGQIRDLYNLYNSSADSISPLTGQQLVAEKVSRIVIMGGDYPSGTEFNFLEDPAATQVINEIATTTSSTPVIFTGYTLGNSVVTGGSFVATASTSPIMFGYSKYGYSRASWDVIAMFYAIYGSNYGGTSYFSYGAPGYNTVQSNGDNTWISGAATNEEYLVATAATTTIAATLNTLMSALPARNEAPFTVTGNGCTTPYNLGFGQTSILSAPLNSIYESIAIGQRPANDNFSSLVLNPTQTLNRGFDADVYDPGTSAYYFQIYDRAATATRMTINSSGDIGIGTSTPTQLLTFNGNALLTNNGTLLLNRTASTQYTNAVF
jgi:hypothetical protein